MLKAELHRGFYTGRGYVPAGEVLSGEDAEMALKAGVAVPVKEDRKIERAVIRRKSFKKEMQSPLY